MDLRTILLTIGAVLIVGVIVYGLWQGDKVKPDRGARHSGAGSGGEGTVGSH